MGADLPEEICQDVNSPNACDLVTVFIVSLMPGALPGMEEVLVHLLIYFVNKHISQ